MRGLSLLLIALGCSTAQLVLAQAVPPAPPEPPAPRVPQPPLDPKAQRYQEAPGESFLSQRYGLGKQQALRQLALENDVSTAAAALQARYKDEFLASIIDHTPVFQATFVFSRDVPTDEVRQLLPDSLRSAFKMKRSRYTAEQIRTRREQVLEAMRTLRIPASVGYDHRTDKFELTTEQERGNRLMASLPAELRNEVRFVPGGVPKSFQSGARAGDALYGGWRLHQLSGGGGQQICTFGFTVLLPGDAPGITASAAEHCQGTVGIIYDDSHQVTMPTPPFENHYVYNNTFGVGRSYDFRVFRSGTLTSGPYAWFWNNLSGSYWQFVYPNWVQKSWKNSKPDYIANGAYSRVTDAVAGTSGTSNTNHPQGATRCKGGITTGITCAPITLSESAATQFLDDGSSQTFYGFVKIEGGSNYQVLSYEGDSGAPVTTAPVWNINAQYYDVNAAGLFVLGSVRNRGDDLDRPCVTPSDGACPAYYMPIDRVNDYNAVRIWTVTGGADPL